MLNIIPENQKKELRLEKVFFRIRKICLLIIVTIIFLSLLLIGNYYILAQVVTNIQEDILVNSINLPGIENLKEDIIDFNSQLVTAKQIQNNHTNPLLILESFFNLIPSGVTLNYLSFNLAEETISIQGVSENRNILLKLQTNLNNSELFIDFDYPLGSLTEKEDITFLFDGKIDLSKL